jgi:hypothetical protein
MGRERWRGGGARREDEGGGLSTKTIVSLYHIKIFFQTKTKHTSQKHVHK